jgi:transcriptional regulator with XRE-family HTH domain
MKIKELRLKRKLSQEELGRMIGESGNTISNWERGISNPDVKKTEKLAEALKVSLNLLLSDADEPFHPVEDFASSYGCQECKSKDMEIELLRERIKELKEFIEYLKKEKAG